MFNPIALLLPGKSINSVMSTFRKTIEDLEDVAEFHQIKHEKHNAKIEKLLDQVDDHSAKAIDHEAESQAALALADKLSATFGLN